MNRLLVCMTRIAGGNTATQIQSMYERGMNDSREDEGCDIGNFWKLGLKREVETYWLMVAPQKLVVAC